MSLGRLYGVGTGPGDPELVTRRAWSLIETATVIAYPAPDNGVSFARSIVTDAISGDTIEIPMVVPMRSGRMPAQSIYDQGAEAIKTHLDAGRDVIVLCEGDPLFYGSFMYLFARMTPRYAIQVVPGVSSLTACASALAAPLAGRNDVLMVIPATLDAADIIARLQQCDAAAIIKVGRHTAKIRQILHDMGLSECARYVEHATMTSQRVRELDSVDDGSAPYFSMVLVHRRGLAWQ